MSYRDYYFTRRELGRIQEHSFLRFPHQASLDDGTPHLVGALCERGAGVTRNWFRPRVLTRRNHILGELVERRGDVAGKLGIDEGQVEIERSETLAGVTLKLKKHHVLGLKATLEIPNLPVELTVGFNGDWLKEMEVTWGADTVVHYVPKGVLMALYDVVDGEDEAIVPNGLLGDHYIAQSVITAKSWTVKLKSEEKIGAELKAKLDAKKVAAGGELDFKAENSTTLSVTVQGDTPYVVGLSGVRWRGLKG